jgi:hypothetical protein
MEIYMNDIYDVSVSSFQKYMERGLGRTFLILENSEDIEKYKDVILYGCLNNLSYDIQIEGTKAHYVFHLMTFFDDIEYFENRIYDKFSTDLDYGTFGHFCDFLVLLYNNEYKREKAKSLLENCYKNLIERKSFVADDLSKLEYICISLTETGGLRRAKKIVLDIDAIYPKLVEVDDLGWFFFHLITRYNKVIGFIKDNCKHIKAEDIENYIYGHRKENKEENENLLFAEYVLKEIIDHKEKYYFPYHFACNATETEKQKLLNYYFQEQDEDVKIKLLYIMSKGHFPVTYEEMVNQFNQSSDRLKQAILQVIINLKDPRIKDFGYSLLNNKEFCHCGIEMICKYYSKEDHDTVVSYAKALPIAYDNYGWHAAFSAILDLLSTKLRNLPKELLFYMYEKTLCSTCREYFVREMKKKNMLTEQIIEECKHDSNSDIRKYAYRLSRK